MQEIYGQGHVSCPLFFFIALVISRYKFFFWCYKLTPDAMVLYTHSQDDLLNLLVHKFYANTNSRTSRIRTLMHLPNLTGI